MRAVVITSHGGVEGIGVLEVESPPSPVADRVRVRVHAAGLNRSDILQRRGHYSAPPGYPTNIPGLEFAGEVESIGEAVRTWKVGDRVFGITARTTLRDGDTVGRLRWGLSSTQAKGKSATAMEVTDSTFGCLGDTGATAEGWRLLFQDGFKSWVERTT
jgi:NADPH:quinone reductase-like Zn-dependent oxidoreductase